ncbi:hypothetical protein FD755_018517, partial [Muntiacus reevesi]
AVIFDGFGGVQDIVTGEGTHFLIPWVQKPISDSRSRPCNVPVNTGSKDLQNVIITLRILLWPVAGQLPRIFPSTGEDYDENVLPDHHYRDPPARELASRQVSDDLTERAETFGLILDDRSLMNLTFGKFTERARFVEEKVEQQKKKAIISAEGDSKAAELIANSLLPRSWNITYLPAGQSGLHPLPQ